MGNTCKSMAVYDKTHYNKKNNNNKKVKKQAFPGGSVVKNLPANAGKHEFNP